MINFTSTNNIMLRRAKALFGALDASITWRLIESTIELTDDTNYHRLVNDLMTNEDNYHVDDVDYVLPCSYVFASLEDFEHDNKRSHLTLDLIRELYNHVVFRMEEMSLEKKTAEKVINIILEEC